MSDPVVPAPRFIEVTKKISPTGPEMYLRTCARDWTTSEFLDWLYEQPSGISGEVAEEMDPSWHRHPFLNIHHMHGHDGSHTHEPEVQWGRAIPWPEGLEVGSKSAEAIPVQRGEAAA